MAIKAEMSPKEIKETKPYIEWGLTEKEFDFISEQLLGRLPNYTETGLFSVMWSEHCSYKKSKPVLREFPNRSERVLQGPGEGAGIVDIGDGQAVVFKAESHNHPSAVEPYEGAATGVGGIIRDIFSMGARPIAMLDSLHFGEVDNAHTRYLINEVVAGIGGYGNCMGIPTVGGETTFDECYTGNPLVNAMCVGIMDQNDMQKGRAKGVGNAVMYVGAKTGRDGIHGATFASADFADDKETQRSAVQVGDPFMEKLLMEACLELTGQHKDWLVGIQDMGAAGIVSSSCEMASKAGSGMELILDYVPQREPEMSAYEIMLSESQERMLLCIRAGFEEEVRSLFKDYGLEAVVIGRVTEGNDYVLKHKGEIVTNIPVSSLTEDVLEEPSEETKPERISVSEKLNNWVPDILDARETLGKMLAQPTVASKKIFTQTYDSQVRTSTVVGPGSDAAVLRIRGTKKGLAMTSDGNGRFVYLNPLIGGQIAVLEAAANLIASGALPLAMTDCLNYGDPNDPEIYWELHKSVLGMSEVCRVLNTPVISGNVSLYNENNGEAIYPTPMVGMVGLIKNINGYLTNTFRKSGAKVFLVGETFADFAGSEIQKMMTGKISGNLRSINVNSESEKFFKLLKAIELGIVDSAHDLSEGGLAVGLAESLFSSGLGLKANLTTMSLAFLFSETPGRFVVSVVPENVENFIELMKDDCTEIGEVTTNRKLQIKCQDTEFDFSVEEAQKSLGGSNTMPYEIKGLNEECGVFGVFGTPEANHLTYFGLHSLQHRGQEGAGIVVSDGKKLKQFRNRGLLAEVFSNKENLDNLVGTAAIGHVRYGTSGNNILANVQPFLFHFGDGDVALAHNGNLTNAESMKRELEKDGAIFQSTSDTEILIHLIRQKKDMPFIDALKASLNQVHGGFAFLLLREDSLIAALDPNGFRPLSIGQLENGSYVVVSETCALDMVGAKLVRDVQPGELVIIDKEGLHIDRYTQDTQLAICSMEYIYFSRPDSIIHGVTVHNARKKMGRLLAQQSPLDVDMVIGVPNSSLSAASGYAEESGLPYEMGLIKNQYIARTFIQPTQELRERGVKMKLSAVRGVVEGKKVAIIDDSIVRGTTSKQIVRLLKEAGAKEVHMRIASPPLRFPCFYGIDISTRSELMAANYTVDEMCKEIGADSLEFLTIPNLIKAIDIPDAKNAPNGGLCVAYFDGNYPTPLYDYEDGYLKSLKRQQKLEVGIK